MPIMKVVFLDIDGVLNSDATPNPRGFPFIVDKKLLARLQRLLQRSGAKAVLTSSWRHDPIGLLAVKYFKIPCFDLCPDLAKQPRCKESLRWPKEHPRVTRFAVIDDEDDGLDELPLFQPSKKT